MTRSLEIAPRATEVVMNEPFDIVISYENSIRQTVLPAEPIGDEYGMFAPHWHGATSFVRTSDGSLFPLDAAQSFVRVVLLLVCALVVGCVLSTSFVACSEVSSSSPVQGGPSLSASFIDADLAHYQSPAVGLGATLYAESQASGIDDVYALAFFLHESSFGTAGVARQTRSLGNIICAGYPSCLGRFRSYSTWRAGAHDWYRLIRVEYIARGLTTLEQIVPVYAPSSENDVSAYIRAVSRAAAAWRSGSLEVRS